MTEKTKKLMELQAENEELKIRLAEAEETLNAIQSGEVDALVVSSPDGDQIYSLEGADQAYRTLIEEMGEGAAILMNDGTVFYCNSRLADMVKVPLGEIMGNSLNVFVSPKDSRIYEALLKKGLERNNSSGEISLKVSDGTYLPVFISIKKLKMRDLEGVSLNITDLSEQKRNQEIVASERLSRSIFEQAGESIIVCDEDGIITRTSDISYNLCNCNPILEYFNNVFRLFDENMEIFSISSVLKGKSIQRMEVFSKQDDGSRSYFLLNARTIHNDENVLLGCIIILTDITSRKKAEEALIKSNERFELLSDAASTLLSSETPEKIVETICKKVMNSLGCDVFFNYLLDEKEQRLHLNAYSGVPEETGKSIEWLDLGVAVCGCVARDNSRIIAENVQETPDERTELVKSFGIKAYACHPIISKDHTIGTLSFGTKSRSHFNEDELELMKAVTNYVATAMERKIREEEVTQARDDWEKTFDAVPDLIVILDHEHKVIRANKAMAARLGVTPKESIGLPCYRAVHGTDEPPSFCPHSKLLEDGCEHTTEVQEESLGGNFIVSVSPLYNSDKQFMGSVHVAHDITKRKRAEEALKESEEKYRSIIENIQEGFFRLDKEGKIIMASPSLAKMYGFGSSKEMIGITTAPLYKNIEDREQMLRELNKQGKLNEYEIEAVRGNTSFWTAVNAQFYYDDQNQIQGIEGFTRDITLRKQAEKALKESEERYYNLFKDNHAVMLLIEPETGKIVDSNSAADSFYGYSSEEMLRMNISDINILDDKDVSYEMQKAQSKEKRHFIFKHRLSNAEIRNVSVYSGPLNFGNKTLLYSIIHDITEQKKSEKQIKKLLEETQELNKELELSNKELEIYSNQLKGANDELEAFAYSVSHDLRTPLRAIDGYSQVLLRRYDDKLDENGKRFLNNVRDNTEMMSNLINDILALSRAGRTEIEKSDVDIESLVKNIIEELKPTMNGRNIQFKVDSLPNAYSDRTAMRQILTNLLSNSIKFTEPKKTALIEVGAEEKMDEITYYVKDNGVGFNMKYINKLFDLFQRLHSQKEFEGTGVGLTIVKRLINRQGGHIWAESKVDNGAIFYFTLPKT